MSQPRHRDLDPDADPFRPPEIPTEVRCQHCGREYKSDSIEQREKRDANGKTSAFWCCPTPNCGGLGFGFDILPTDPEYRDERGGWCCDDEYDKLDDDSNSDEFDNDEPYREYENPGDDSDIPF